MIAATTTTHELFNSSSSGYPSKRDETITLDFPSPFLKDTNKDVEIGKQYCPVCMSDSPENMIKLECSHEFHRECIEGQLNARWTGKRISFDYLNCALCRERLAHPEFPLAKHLALREKVLELCSRRAQKDELIACMDEDLVMQTMVAYQCKTCNEPFCGGRVDCLEEEAMDVDLLMCTPCLWKEPSERKCREHGADFAIYKCDSCCAIATWDCSGNHFCDRCHGMAGVAKSFPCPGPDKCPLGVPHPANTQGVHLTQYKAFVLGCSKCFAQDEVSFEAVSSQTRQRF